MASIYVLAEIWRHHRIVYACAKGVSSNIWSTLSVPIYKLFK